MRRRRRVDASGLVVTQRHARTVEMTQITPGGHLLVADPKGGNPRMYQPDGSMVGRDGRIIRNPRIPAPAWWLA